MYTCSKLLISVKQVFWYQPIIQSTSTAALFKRDVGKKKKKDICSESYTNLQLI